jgi:hypothetical protein
MSTDDTKPKLTFVQKVVIAGEEFDLAKNGHFTLVRICGPDAYDRSWGEEVPLRDVSTPETIQSLLDLLGEALAGVRHSRDQRLGTGTGGDE